MSNLDEIYNDYDLKNRQYSKEEYSEYKKKEKKEVYELIDEMAKKIVTNEKDFIQYLDTQSKFDSYSLNNALLITAQMPKATQIKDYDSWEKTGAYIKKNAKGIKILEPGDTYMREDGSVGTNYNIKRVYDITQVNSKQKVRNMRYDDKVLMKAFLNSSISKVEVVDEIPNTDQKALFDYSKNTLYIARGAEAPNIFYDVTQELALQEISKNDNSEISIIESFKCHCASYMLCKKYNIDVSKFDFSVIPQQLQNLEAQDIRKELEPIKDAVENINSRISSYIHQLNRDNKENGLK